MPHDPITQDTHLDTDRDVGLTPGAYRASAGTGAPLAHFRPLIDTQLAMLETIDGDAADPRLNTVTLATSIAQYLDRMSVTIGSEVIQSKVKDKLRAARLFDRHLLSALPGDVALSALTGDDWRRVVTGIEATGMDLHATKAVFGLFADMSRRAHAHGFSPSDDAAAPLEALRARWDRSDRSAMRPRLGGLSGMQRLIRNSTITAGISEPVD